MESVFHKITFYLNKTVVEKKSTLFSVVMTICFYCVHFFILVGIKILEGFGVKYAVDRFTHNSLIVGTFDDNKTLCGILRIFLKAKQEKLETQQYLCKNSLKQNQNLQKLLLKPNLAEIQRVFVSSNYRKQGLYYMLFDVALQILIDLNLQLVMNSEYPMFQNSCCGKRWENIIDHNKKYNVLYFDEEDLPKLHGHIKKEMKTIYKKARKPDSQCPKKNIYDKQCKPK